MVPDTLRPDYLETACDEITRAYQCPDHSRQAQLNCTDCTLLVVLRRRRIRSGAGPYLMVMGSSGFTVEPFPVMLGFLPKGVP
jgi:hypothetical protein